MLLSSIPVPPLGLVRLGGQDEVPVAYPSGGKVQRQIGITMRKVSRPALHLEGSRWHWRDVEFTRQEFTEDHVLDVAGKRKILEASDRIWSPPPVRFPFPLLYDIAPAQKQAVTEMVEAKSAILAGEVGSGKTRTALVAMHVALSRTKGRAVVVAPAGLVAPGHDGESQWSRSARAIHCDSLRITYLSYEQAVKDDWLLKHASEFSVCVIDEAHRLCSMASARAKSLLQVRPEYRFALTATPFPNRPADIYNLLKWVDAPGLPGRQWFTDLHTPIEINRETGQRRYAPGISCPLAYLDTIGSKVVVLTKQDIKPELPLPRIKRVDCSMSVEQAVAYNYWLTQPPAGGAGEAWTMIAHLRECCAEPWSHARKHGGPPVPSPANGKLLHIVETCSARALIGQPTLVVCSRLAQSDAVVEMLSQQGIQCARIDTSTSGKHGQQADDFRSGRKLVLIMGVKCAEGHSFSDCDKLLIASHEWAGQTMPQAIGRICRLDSSGTADIEILVHPDTIEEHIVARLNCRSDLASAILSGDTFDGDLDEYAAAACRPIVTANLKPASNYNGTFKHQPEAVASANFA